MSRVLRPAGAAGRRRTWRRGAAVILGVLVLIGTGRAGEREPTEDAPREPWRAPPEAQGTSNPVAGDPEAGTRGAAVYAKYCFSCHGDTGRGDGPVAIRLGFSAGDLGAPDVAAQSDGAIFWKIATGRDPMPGFRTTRALTDAQIWEVVVHMRSLAREGADDDAKRDDPPRD